GLLKGNNLWPRMKPIFEACTKSNEIGVGNKLVDLYEKANAELAPKMEELLAVRWKAAGNAKLTARADRAAAIRNSMASAARSAKISQADRLKQLQELLGKTTTPPDKPAGQPQIASLQETVRLAHASTMASILFSKDG